jgi:hypothetical protein
MYITLIDSKISAVKYLRLIKDDFEDKSDLICKLADIYVEEEKILKEGLECVPKPSRIKYRKDWTMKMRRKQAEIIEEHLQLEKKSLEVLKRLNYGVFR